MASFEAQVAAFRAKVNARQREIFVGTVSDLKGSIQDGSPVTGAPGQPVDTGTLRGAWQDTYPEQWVGQVAVPSSSPAASYCKAIEDGQQESYTTASGATVTPRPIQFRSPVGGAHSVRLSRVGFQPLVNSVVRRVVG